MTAHNSARNDASLGVRTPIPGTRELRDQMRRGMRAPPGGHGTGPERKGAWASTGRGTKATETTCTVGRSMACPNCSRSTCSGVVRSQKADLQISVRQQDSCSVWRRWTGASLSWFSLQQQASTLGCSSSMQQERTSTSPSWSIPEQRQTPSPLGSIQAGKQRKIRIQLAIGCSVYRMNLDPRSTGSLQFRAHSQTKQEGGSQECSQDLG